MTIYMFLFTCISLFDVQYFLYYLCGVCHQLVPVVSEGVQGQLPLLLPLIQILVQRLHELGASNLRQQLQSDRHTRLIAGLKIFQLKYHLYSG